MMHPIPILEIGLLHPISGILNIRGRTLFPVLIHPNSNTC